MRTRILLLVAALWLLPAGSWAACTLSANGIETCDQHPTAPGYVRIYEADDETGDSYFELTVPDAGGLTGAGANTCTVGADGLIPVDCLGAADGELLDMSSVSVTSATEGLILPQHATDCSTLGTAEGQVCWQADADTLYIGDGTTVTALSGAGDITAVYQCASGACSSIALADGDLLDMSAVSVTGVAEGLILPQHATDCSTVGTTEGQICWEADANTLYVGNGATVTQIASGGAEVNDLEAQDPSTIADTEIYVGDGAGSGTFVVVSGDATLANTGALTIAAGAVDEDMLAATLTFDDGDLLDFGSNVTGATEGLMLPAHATDCSTATAEGQVCWEEDAAALWVGDGAAAQQMNGGGSTVTGRVWQNGQAGSPSTLNPASLNDDCMCVLATIPFEMTDPDLIELDVVTTDATTGIQTGFAIYNYAGSTQHFSCSPPVSATGPTTCTDGTVTTITAGDYWICTAADNDADNAGPRYARLNSPNDGGREGYFIETNGCTDAVMPATLTSPTATWAEGYYTPVFKLFDE